MCVWRLSFSVALYAHCGHGNFWLSWTDFMCCVSLKDFFLSEHGPTMCAWKLFTFMHWFYVSLKISFLSGFVFTLWAWKLLTFMDWFYVCLKVFFPSCFVVTLWAWDLLKFMQWFYMSLKVFILCCFVFTLGTLMAFEYHSIIKYFLDKSTQQYWLI